VRHTLGLVLAGGTVATAGAAGFFAFQARSASNDVSTAAANGLPYDPARDLSGRHAQTAMIACTAAAGVLLTLSLVLLLGGNP
jgi:hypothetical protein